MATAPPADPRRRTTCRGSTWVLCEVLGWKCSSLWKQQMTVNYSHRSFLSSFTLPGLLCVLTTISASQGCVSTPAEKGPAWHPYDGNTLKRQSHTHKKIHSRSTSLQSTVERRQRPGSGADGAPPRTSCSWFKNWPTVHFGRPVNNTGEITVPSPQACRGG